MIVSVLLVKTAVPVKMVYKALPVFVRMGTLENFVIQVSRFSISRH